jgi:Flp pilus assembly protein TadD
MLLDDTRYVEKNPRLRSPADLTTVLSGRRPILDFSLAINVAIGGPGVTSFHVVNILIHLTAGLFLFGVVRRTLEGLHDDRPRAENGEVARNDEQRGCSAERSGYSAAIVAFVIALLWLVHPLQTQSVTYIIQRSESLMGMFYLLTLYSVIRAAQRWTDEGKWDQNRDRQGADRVEGEGKDGRSESARDGEAVHRRKRWPGRVAWSLLAIIACALGMGSKGVMVSAPLVVLLYDRVFLSSSWKDVFRRRWGLYAGLCLTWLVLWATDVGPGILSTDRRIATTGFSFKGITPLEYLQTQAGVILRYLRLSVLPVGLCLDYAWPVAKGFSEYALAGAIVLALLAMTVWALIRRPAWGFVGAWFFVILAPTSTIVPIKDPIFEHRMYLPLASIVTVMVLAGAWFLHRTYARLSLSAPARRRISTTVVCLAAGALMAGTIHRNRAYASAEVMWRDVIKKQPNSLRGHYNLGTDLLHRNQLASAIEALERAAAVDPKSAEVRYNLGKALARTGRTDDAERQFIESLRINPNMAAAHSDLGNILARKQQTAEAIGHYEAAIRSDPNYVQAYYNLGIVLLAVGRTPEALQPLKTAVELAPDETHVRFALAEALRETGRVEEAKAEYRTVLSLDANHVESKRRLDELGPS